MRGRGVLVCLALLGCNEDLSLPPVPTSTGGGCSQDSDCAQGICDVNHVCQANGCRTNAQCQWGLCTVDDTCNPNLCQTNANCQTGQCLGSGTCVPMTGCTMDGECDGGSVCISGTCEVGCRQDSQCSGCSRCLTGGNAWGQCSVGTGPTLLGSPTALKMTDNLASTVTWIRQMSPGAQLVEIIGSELKSDGTIDITKDYTSEWMYGFHVADGGSQTLRVNFFLSGGTKCGYLMTQSTGVPTGPTIPDTAWPSFEDGTQLVAKFVAHAGCNAPAQMFQDGLIYNEGSGAAQFVLTTAAGQGWVDADPSTGTGGIFNCP